MAHKTLLTEGEIRQFLKLANLKNVGDDKIQEYGGMMPGERDEEAVDMVAMDDEAPPMDDDMPPMDDDAGDMADDADDMDMDAGAMGGMDDTEREEVLADVVAAVAQALGIEDRVNVEAGEEDAMDDMDMDMGDEPMDMGMEPEAGLAPEEGGEDSLEGTDDLVGVELEDDEEEPVQMSEDEIVAEVARRVARRLKEERSRDNMADVLAERIMKRLTKK